MSDLLDLSSDAQAQKVIELMFEGLTKKAACEQSGVVVRTFDRWLATNPDIIKQLRDWNTARRSKFLDRLAENSDKNMDALLDFSDTLRAHLKVDSVLDIKEAISAAASLTKLEKMFQSAQDKILPEVKEAVIQPPSGISDSRALELLSQLSGARVTITKTIEVGESPIPVDNVLEGQIQNSE